MSIQDEALDILVGADRSYGVNTGRAALEAALSDVEHGPPLREWAVRHMGLENLLTIEELSLYAALDQNGHVDSLAAAHDLAEVQPITEDEIRLATEELRKSTTEINKQTETLQQQRQALARLASKSTEHSSRRRDFEASQQRKLVAEHQSLAAEVGEISEGLQIRLSDLKQQDDDLQAKTQETVLASLQSDDKLLESLRKLGRQLEQQDPDETKHIDQVRMIGYRLIKTIVETTRARLDRVYLEALGDAVHQQPTSSSREELKALEEEVESLYAEILPVSQMSIEQQYMEPALNTVNSRNGQDQHRTAAALTYITQCLAHVIDKTSRLQERVMSTKARQDDSLALKVIVDEELAPIITASSRPAKPEVPASPVRKAPKSRRRSSIAYDESPLEVLLGSLGIVAPEDEAELLAQLQRTLLDRRRKGDDISRNGQDSYEAIMSSHMEDMRSATQLLRDSVFAESAFRDVKMVDPEFESSIGDVLAEAHQLQSQVDRATIMLSGEKSIKKQDLVSRFTTYYDGPR